MAHGYGWEPGEINSWSPIIEEAVNHLSALDDWSNVPDHVFNDLAIAACIDFYAYVDRRDGRTLDDFVRDAETRLDIDLGGRFRGSREPGSIISATADTADVATSGAETAPGYHGMLGDIDWLPKKDD